MTPLLATSYNGLPESVALWFVAVLLCVGVATLLTRSTQKWIAVCGVVLASLNVLFVLPPVVFLVFLTASVFGTIALEWVGVIALALATCTAVGYALFNSIGRLRHHGRNHPEET